jgi:hypothetical protein
MFSELRHISEKYISCDVQIYLDGVHVERMEEMRNALKIWSKNSKEETTSESQV